MLIDLVKRSRTFRRFDESVSVSMATLRELVALARFSPSAANRQPLKFKLYNDAADRETIFRSLAWAGALPRWGGPKEGERPMAYILILGDTEITSSFAVDEGIMAQSMMLGAADQGLGGIFPARLVRVELRNADGDHEHRGRGYDGHDRQYGLQEAADPSPVAPVSPAHEDGSGDGGDAAFP
mgnify:CR=1 FL=1